MPITWRDGYTSLHIHESRKIVDTKAQDALRIGGVIRR
jgi:hypothetical protein